MSTSNGNSPNGHVPPQIVPEDLLQFNATDGSNSQYRKPPSEHTEPVWHLGWTDGRYGQPRTIHEEVLRSQVQLDWINRVHTAEIETATTRAGVNYWSDVYGRLKDKHQEVKDLYDKLWGERKENYQEFSGLLAFVYMFFALLLILADIPLTLRLVALGFNVDTQFLSDPKNATSIVRVDDLLSQPWLVSTRLWEALLLALGIACAGIFIKFFLDSIVLRPESKPPLSKRYKYAMYFVLCLFLATNFTLGFFRSVMQREVTNREINKQVEDTYAKRVKLNVPADKAQIRQEVEANSKKENGWALPSFILLTLLLPIVGGVCFSEGWKRFENAKHFYSARFARWRVERKLDNAHLKWQQSSESLAAHEAQLNRLSSDALKDTQINLQLNLYRHGYSRGQNVPETIDANEGLYQRCEKALVRMLARKTRAESWHGFPPNSN